MFLDEIALQRSKWHLAALRVELKLLHLGLALHAYNPGQPRLPAGRPDGGQWTNEEEDGANQSVDGGQIIFTGVGDNPRYTVILEEEEARGGHTIRRHVGKTDE